MVVAGRADPEVDWPPQLVDRVRMARHNALDIAARYRAAGFAVVIDDFLDPPLLGEYGPLASDLHAVRICLTPPVDVALERNRTRGGSDEWVAYLEEGIRVLTALALEHHHVLSGGGWVMLDNGDLTVDQTVTAIRALGPPVTD
jgi:hypothetical protein